MTHRTEPLGPQKHKSCECFFLFALKIWGFSAPLNMKALELPMVLRMDLPEAQRLLPRPRRPEIRGQMNEQ